LIPFNLGKVVLQHDPLENLSLLPGDVVTILNQNDLRLPQHRQTRLIKIEGEVAAPGVYQVDPGETLPKLLQRLGGLTPQAYVFGAEFTRESIRLRQQENLDVITRRLESQLQSQAFNVSTNRTQDQSVQLQVQNEAQKQSRLQMQVQSQLDRIKSFRSNGRMSLELDTKAQSLSSLPDLPLEDGDHIVIPSVPSFVSAFGAVNNESVLIHKPGKTVADIIKFAGLTEDAEASQAFLLRADGSIVARRDYSGLFDRNFESIKLMPGDTLVVPTQIDRETRYNFVTRTFKDWTQILSNFGLGMAALRILK